MSRAHELRPIPPREHPERPMPWLELCVEHRAELDMAERFVPGPPGTPEVRVAVYQPSARRTPILPVLFQIHGGAF